jgi:glycerophosphoryl diester phosphodiesterase
VKAVSISAPSISAHKGGGENVSPATYEAYKASLASGAEYAEFDIRKTLDGTLVAYHDARADHTGPAVADLAYEDLCARLDYEVPRVDEVMRLLAGKVAGHLDLKETGYEEEVIDLAMGTFGAGNFVATTLEDISIKRIKQSFPEVRAALSLGRDLSQLPRNERAGVRFREYFPLSRIRACGADWVAVNHKLARRGVLRSCQRHGIGAMVWTVDEDRLIDMFLADDRVDVLITNRPGHAVRRRAELGARMAS